MDARGLLNKALNYRVQGYKPMNTELGLLSTALPSPYGDAVGLLADAAGYAENPKSLTPASGLLSLAALLPGVPRRLPLDDFGQFSKYRSPLPKGSVYRETSGSGLMDMTGGGYPFGSPDWHFAEAPEMALGQGSNKGLMIKVNAEGLAGKWSFHKPGLDKAFLEGAGELTIREQPGKVFNAIEEVFVSPAAYAGMKSWEKKRLDSLLTMLERKGVPVNKVEVLPGR